MGVLATIFIYMYKYNMKQYNGEKAIISLTSWKARIKTVSKTIFSIIQKCPGYHIVLVLSEEEFPKKEEELPEDLLLLINNDLIELMWVYKNYRSFKKVLFTMNKYRDVPVVSADDGQMYIDNFAEKLYAIWEKNKNCIISNTHFRFYKVDCGCGCRGILYPPYCFGEDGLTYLTDAVVKTNHDDAYIGILAHFSGIKWIFTNRLNIRKNNFKVFNEAEKYGLTKNHKFNGYAFKIIMNNIKVIKSREFSKSKTK